MSFLHYLIRGHHGKKSEAQGLEKEIQQSQSEEKPQEGRSPASQIRSQESRIDDSESAALTSLNLQVEIWVQRTLSMFSPDPPSATGNTAREKTRSAMT
jgi:hypothetical protein